MQKALEIDPEFAMAHRSVAMSHSNLGHRPAKRKALEKAFELIDRVSERERYLIEAEYYRLLESTWDKAKEAYEKLLKLYPDDVIANTNLGFLYFDLEEYEKAIEFTEIVIKAYPEGFIAYWNLIETYEAMGLYEKAHETIEDYLKNNPDDRRFHRKQAIVYLYEGKYDLALAKLEKVLSLNPDEKLDITILRGITHMLRGDLVRAELEFKKIPETSGARRHNLIMLFLLKGKFEEVENMMRQKPVMKEALATFYLGAGNPEEALKGFEKVWSDAAKAESLYWQIRTLHLKGLAYTKMQSIDEALRTAVELKDLIQKAMNKKYIRYYYHLMGMIELESKNFSKAIKFLTKARDLLYAPNENFPEYNPFFTYFLAEALYKAENLEKAQREYENIISLALGRLNSGDFYAKSFYMLGKIFEEKGQEQKSIENYEKFLDLWKDADPGIPEVEDAEKRLAALKSQ